VADEIRVPEDLTQLSDADLSALERDALAEFDRLNDSDTVTAELLERLEALASGIERLKAQATHREEQATERAAKREALRERIRPVEAVAEPEAEGEPEVPEATEEPAEDAVVETTEAPEAVAASATVFADALMNRLEARLQVREPSARLSEARRHQPTQPAPPARLAITAGADIPGVPRGGALDDLDALVEAVHSRARTLPVTSTPNARGYEGVPAAYVASARNEFEHTLEVRGGDLAQPSDVEELYRELVSRDKQEALVAGGGWCAPSETRYSFYEIGDSPAAVDLPSFGVNRGGIRWPDSLSLADVLPDTFTNATTPFLWTETDDILTVTGSTNKPCVRVPCPDFNEERLDLYGYCVTAGNLANDAYPEMTRQYLRNLLLAFEHVKNRHIISEMVTLSSAIVTGGEFDDADLPVYQQVYGSVALAAVDYRLRYGLNENAVLEVILPLWIKEMVRSDLAWRNGVDLLDVEEARIMQGFARRRIRPQFVDDWQVRGSGAGALGSATTQSAWPTSVDFLLYSAGTFALGNGMVLDLAVLRDSVLNAENDHTAAFFEEAHLVARFGHESRQYRVQISVNGNTGLNTTAGDNV